MFTFRCFRKSFSTLLLFLLVSSTVLSAVELFQPRFPTVFSEPKPSTIFPVNVTITYEGVVEKIMFADHSENLEEGNWIALSGGSTVTLPPTTLVYKGVSSATYVRDNRTIKIESAFDSRELKYPMTSHQVYYPGDTIKATFYGSAELAGEKVDIRLIKTSPLEARDVLRDAFEGDISNLRSLISKPVWEMKNVKLDSKGDATVSFKLDEPGDYALLVLSEEENGGTYELKLFSATMVEVLDYKVDVTAPSSVTRGKPVDIRVKLTGAPKSEKGYRYGALIIYEPAYSVTVRLETNGTVPGTTLTANGALLLNGTAERTFLIAGVGLTAINKNLIAERTVTAFGANRVSIGFSDVTNETEVSLSLMTDESMPTGRYILLIGVWELQTGRRVVALYQGYVELTVPPVVVPPVVVPPPTPEEVEAMPTEAAASYLETLTATDAVYYLERLSLSKATEIIGVLSLDKAVEVFGLLTLERAVGIFEKGVLTNLTARIANIMLALNVSKSAEIMLSVNVTLAPPVVEQMVKANATQTARVVEEMAVSNLTRTAEVLEKVSPKSLALILLEISRLPSTPETAAKLLEALSLSKAVEAVKAMISLGALEELGEIFKYLSTVRLNEIYGSLTIDERAELLPYLSPETVSRISANLLPLPDLKPTAITVKPVEPKAEQPCTVNVTVENVGNIDSGRFNVTVKVDNATIAAFQVEKLPVNSSTTLSLTWTPKVEGVYKLTAIVDPENAVKETNETNNILSLTVTVKPKPLPDLTPTTITVAPPEPSVGENCTVNVTVLNTGTAESPPFKVLLKADGLTVQTLTVEKLPVNGLAVLRFTWTPTRSGNHTLTVIADPDNAVEELNETNNVLSITVTVKALPDLTVEIVNLPASFEAGKEYSINVLTRNIGEGDAGAFNVRLEFNGHLIGVKTVEALPAGSDRTITFTWRPEEAGRYVLRATVDPENAVREVNEANNVAEVEVTVAPPWYVTWLPAIVAVIVIVVAVVVYLVWKRSKKGKT
jgi:methanogen extracellular protein (TIGR04279 family)